MNQMTSKKYLNFFYFFFFFFFFFFFENFSILTFKARYLNNS